MKACASYRHHLLSTQTAETVTRGAIRRDRPALTAGAGTILYTAEIPRDTYRSTSFFILKNIYKILRYFLHLGIFFYRCFFIDGAPSPPDPRLLRTVATGDPPKKIESFRHTRLRGILLTMDRESHCGRKRSRTRPRYPGGHDPREQLHVFPGRSSARSFKRQPPRSRSHHLFNRMTLC